MDIEKLRKQADWSFFDKKPSWEKLTSAELAKVLGTSVANINQWKLRGHLPPPEPRQRGKGNKNRWVTSRIKNWLYGTPENETHWEFINNHMGEGFESIEQAKWNAKRHSKAYGVEKANGF